MASQQGKNIRNSITKNRFLDFFDRLTAANHIELDIFENKSLLRRFWTWNETSGLDTCKIIVRWRFQGVDVLTGSVSLRGLLDF